MATIVVLVPKSRPIACFFPVRTSAPVLNKSFGDEDVAIGVLPHITGTDDEDRLNPHRRTYRSSRGVYGRTTPFHRPDRWAREPRAWSGPAPDGSSPAPTPCWWQSPQPPSPAPPAPVPRPSPSAPVARPRRDLRLGLAPCQQCRRVPASGPPATDLWPRGSTPRRPLARPAEVAQRYVISWPLPLTTTWSCDFSLRWTLGHAWSASFFATPADRSTSFMAVAVEAVEAFCRTRSTAAYGSATKVSATPLPSANLAGRVTIALYGLITRGEKPVIRRRRAV